MEIILFRFYDPVIYFKMNNLGSMSRVQKSRKMSLLKKTNYYEYLISYAGPGLIHKPADNIKEKNTTHSLFFPNIQLHNMRTTERHQNIVGDSDQEKETPQKIETSISGNRERPFRKTVAKEIFRQGKKEQLNNLNELVAKSMTPFARKTKAELSQKKYMPQKGNKTIDIAMPSGFQERGFSPKRRTYIGNVWYAKLKQRPQKLQISKYRKPSIDGWEVDSSPAAI